MNPLDRRHFLQLAAFGGAVFSSALPGARAATAADEFYFVQLSDSHWGSRGTQGKPQGQGVARGTLPKAVAAVNALREPPDFVIFTGDLTHTTEDGRERRRRMGEFQQIVSQAAACVGALHPRRARCRAGPSGAPISEFFGRPHLPFDHKGVHFIDAGQRERPQGRAWTDGSSQWLEADLKAQPVGSRASW